MTLDEAIKHAEEVAEENQRVVDTGIVFDDVTVDMLYCDDTEVIEEHLANYQKCAEQHRQLAEWLKDYKRLKEQEPSDDCVSRANLINQLEILDKRYGSDFYWEVRKIVDSLPSVTPTRKVGKWTKISNTVPCMNCPICGSTFTLILGGDKMKYCPNCGAEMESEE